MQTTPRPQRRLFHAGHLRPRRALFGATGCAVGRHIGAMLDTARMDAAGGMGAKLATCSQCHATVSRSEFVRPLRCFAPIGDGVRCERLEGECEDHGERRGAA